MTDLSDLVVICDVIVTDLSDLVVICDVIVVLCFSIHTVLTGVLSNEPGYKSSIVTMSAHNCTGKRCFHVRHWVTLAFLNPLFCVLNVGENLSSRCVHLLLCGSSLRFI